MDMSFLLAGGTLEIEKRTFTKEMLKSGSLLKRVVSAPTADLNAKKPRIDKSSKPGWVLVHYNESAGVELGETYSDYFRDLKQELGRDISGQLTMRITSFNTFYSTIDLSEIPD